MQTNKTLRAIALCGVFFLPFIFFWNPNGFFFPFITAKNFLFRIVVEIAFFAYALLALRDARFRPKWSPVLYACVAFLAVLSFADFFGINPARSFWSNSERMDGLVTQIHLFLYFLLALGVLTTEKLWEAFLKTTIGASVLMCFFALLQLGGYVKINQGNVRVDGTLGNATYLAVYLLFHIFFALFLFVRHRKEFAYQFLLIPTLLLQSVILYYTATRGDILGLGVGLFIAAFIIFIQNNVGQGKDPQIQKYSAGVLVLGMLVAGGFYFARTSDFVQKSPVLSRFASISLDDRTTQSRFLIWNMAIEGFKERPILGWGQENFSVVFAKYYNPQMYNQEPWFDRAHNVFFDWLVSGGILGLLAYLGLFAAAIYSIYKSSRFSSAEKALFVGLLAGYFFQNLFVFDNLASYYLFFTLLAFISLRENNDPTIAPQIGKNTEMAASVVLVALFLVSFYLFNVTQISSNKLLIKAMISGSLADFQTALSRDSIAKTEIREQLSLAAVRALGSSVLTEQDKLAYIDFARSEMKKQTKEAPLDVRSKILFASFLNQAGYSEEAIEVLEEAKALSPNKQQIYFELASAYLVKNDLVRSLEAAKQGYDLAPEYEQAALVYATVAIYDGKQNIADTVFEKHPEIESTDDGILRAYVLLKNKAKVDMIWKIRFGKNPDDPDSHVSYGLILSSLGYKQAGIAELRTAIAVAKRIEPDPSRNGSYVTDVEVLILEIQQGKR